MVVQEILIRNFFQFLIDSVLWQIGNACYLFILPCAFYRYRIQDTNPVYLFLWNMQIASGLTTMELNPTLILSYGSLGWHILFASKLCNLASRSFLFHRKMRDVVVPKEVLMEKAKSLNFKPKKKKQNENKTRVMYIPPRYICIIKIAIIWTIKISAQLVHELTGTPAASPIRRIWYLIPSMASFAPSSALIIASLFGSEACSIHWSSNLNFKVQTSTWKKKSRNIGKIPRTWLKKKKKSQENHIRNC